MLPPTEDHADYRVRILTGRHGDGDPVDESLREHIAEVLRIEHSEIIDSSWVDNGPGWVAVLLSSAESVLAPRPGFVDLDLGVVRPYRLGAEAPFELRAFFPKEG